MQLFLNLIKRLVNLGAYFAALLLTLMTLLISTEVFLRKLFGRSTQIAEEYTGYFLAAIIYLAAAYTLEKQEHIRVGIVKDRLGKRASLWLERFVMIVGLLFSVLLSYAFYILFQRSLAHNSRSFMPSRTLLAIPQSAIFIGAFLLFLEFLAKNIRLWQKGKGED